MPNQIDELATYIAHLFANDGICTTAIPRLSIVRSSRPTQEIHLVHEPALCIVLQGAKRVMLGDKVFTYGAGQHILVSYDIPIVGQVTVADPGKPYLCLRLDLDTAVIHELGDQLRRADHIDHRRSGSGPGLSLGTATAELIDAAGRMVRLLDTPEDIQPLAGLYERELLYRVMRDDEGRTAMGHALGLTRGPQIAKAIAWIKSNYREPFDMDRVAHVASLQPSALHQHFKAITMMSPLQYHKRLRLQEARRLMLFESKGAATAAFAVGYESPSQFSREYRRQFGKPPIKDVESFGGAASESSYL